MPSDIKRSDIEQKNDPSVARQLDDAPAETKLADFYSMVDGFKIGLLGSYRANVGPVTRSMAIAKRSGPDFLFLTNAHSQKVNELKERPEVCLSFQNSTSQDWISVTGTATVSSEDSRIKQIWSRAAAAWFGDVGDGKHDGSASDPRMTLIEVKPKCEFFVPSIPSSN